MLTPHSIPSNEPRINVGIILPEDRCTDLVLHIDKTGGYLCTGGGTRLGFTGVGTTVRIMVEDDELRLLSREDEGDLSPKWRFLPPPKGEVLAPGAGLLVKDVVAGRGFHWHKKIDVRLPGVVEVSVVDGHILLINELPLEFYLACVATSEMGAECPQALLEAQTVVARSWMLANVEMKHRQLGFDVCNDDCCQRYQGSTYLSEQAIKSSNATYGRVMMYDDKICDARYSKSCGGMTEAFESVWDGSAHDYLPVLYDGSVESRPAVDLTTEEAFIKWYANGPAAYCSPSVVPENQLHRYLGSVDESGQYYRWKRTIDQHTLVQQVNKIRQTAFKRIDAIEPLERGGSGRLVKIKLIGTDERGNPQQHVLDSEYVIRQALDPEFLYSSAFYVTAETDGKPESFTLHGAGWGHGVGLCQIGALGMALKGKDSSEILSHYLPGADLKKIY